MSKQLLTIIIRNSLLGVVICQQHLSSPVFLKIIQTFTHTDISVSPIIYMIYNPNIHTYRHLCVLFTWFITCQIVPVINISTNMVTWCLIRINETSPLAMKIAYLLFCLVINYLLLQEVVDQKKNLIAADIMMKQLGFLLW